MTREEAIEFLNTDDYESKGYNDAVRMGIEALKERPHGKWEYTGCVNDELQPEFCCSICNFSTYSRQYNFCPNCGADMRKEGDEK